MKNLVDVRAKRAYTFHVAPTAVLFREIGFSPLFEIGHESPQALRF